MLAAAFLEQLRIVLANVLLVILGHTATAVRGHDNLRADGGRARKHGLVDGHSGLQRDKAGGLMLSFLG